MTALFILLLCAMVAVLIGTNSYRRKLATGVVARTGPARPALLVAIIVALIVIAAVLVFILLRLK